MTIKNIILITGALFWGCVVPSQPPENTSAVLFCSSDTVSPYSAIKIAFSTPIEDSAMISFLFSPFFFDYCSVFSSERDTVDLVPSTPFKGSTRYKLTVQNDSFSFFTFAHEQEPNNSIGTADQLFGKMFGSVINVNDTDFFVVKDRNVKSIYLNSYYSESVFSITDSAGKISAAMTLRAVDSLTVPVTFMYPLYIKVFSSFRSSGGYYEIGVLKKIAG
ncbi:MAG TPA: hypothetical protein VHP36_10365 [Chitinispirillaceae bacterium]|nr:hypothetical protein [Chitinispirillaceae bacterium]